MHSKIARTLALSAGLVLATACPDCNDTPGEDAGPGEVAAAAKEMCVAVTLGNNNLFFSSLHSLTRCSVTDGWPEVDAELRQEIEDACVDGNELYDIFVVALEGDRVSLDLDRVRSCVDKGRAARGDVSPFQYNTGAGEGLTGLFEDADCEGAATPLLGEGDTCQQSWDCPDELPCQADPPDAATLRCLPLAPEGERCGGSRGCSGGNSCIDEVCTAPITSGADCVTGNEGGARPCAEGTFCDAADSGVCQPKKPANATCAASAECEDGLTCDADTMTCVVPPDPIADGAACEAGVDACGSYCSVCAPESAAGVSTCRDRGGDGAYCEEDNHCRGAFVCDTNASTCTAPEEEILPGLGEECGVGGAPFDCTEGACVLNLCTAGNEGDPCEVDFAQCQAGLVCGPDAGAAEPGEGTCVPEPGLGDACIGQQCGADAFCNADGNCAAVGNAGDSCGGDVECGSGICLESTNTCAAPSPSCYTSRGIFTQLLTLALLLPLFGRLRRRRRS